MASKLVVAVAATILVVVASGCGGGKKAAAPATTAPGSKTTAASSGSTTVAAAPTFASTKNCQQLVSLAVKASQAFRASATGGTSSLDSEANLLKAMASAAPSQIRGDFETFAGAFSTYAQALAKAGFKPGKIPTAAQQAALATAVKTLSAPKLRVAEQHLSAWAQANCGFGGTTTG